MLTSSTRLRTAGPRSVTSSTRFRPFNRFVTLIRVPSGSFRWAQVMPSILKGWPLAVGSPWNSDPYQLATPNCALAATVECDFSILNSGGLASDEAEIAIRAARTQPTAKYLNCPSLQLLADQSLADPNPNFLFARVCYIQPREGRSRVSSPNGASAYRPVGLLILRFLD
jgi:hypothetical protein